jgi:CubicO group peptidase (beta-lactamase class C family)
VRSPAARSPAADADKEETMSLDAWIEEQRVAFDVPGLAVAVIQDGKTVLSQGFGLRDAEGGLPVTPDTSFAIASVTKAFTAAGVGALVDDGLVEWDRPVREYLSDFQMYDHVATECMTPRDLLCHRSGLPRHDVVWYANTDLTRAEVVSKLRYLQPNKSFRSTWQYNNLMFVTAGRICEVLTEKSWEDLISTRIFARAGMDSSSFSHDASSDVALPYALRKDVVVRIPYQSAPEVCGPAGSIYSTLTDLTAWLRVQLDSGKLGETEVLSPETIKQMHAPQMVMSESTLFPESFNSAYGLGWFIGTHRGHKCVHHGGNIDGFTSLVTMLPNDNIGVVILSNKGGTAIRDAISCHVFDELLGLEPLPWAQRWLDFERSLNTGMKEAKARAERVEGTSLAHPLDDYAGDYEHPAYGRFSVESTDGGLVPHFRSMETRLVHRHYDVFDLELEAIENEQLPVTFQTAPDGRVASISVPLEASVDPIVFTRVREPMPAPEICERFVGTYAIGPIEVEVAFSEPDKLTGTVPGQGTLKLIPDNGLRFKIEDAPGLTVTFVLEGDGPATEIVAQPVGVLKRKPDGE